MKSASTTLLALMLSTTTLSAADLTLPQVLSALQRQGFTEVEVSREPGRVKIEAEGRGMSRELVYDTRTGEILVDNSRDNDDDNGNGGRNDDHNSSSNDDHDDDHGDDDDDDDHDDDHGGDDHGDDDRGGDDHGGDDHDDDRS